jgi:histone-lysine N-methyltransferase SETMAR
MEKLEIRAVIKFFSKKGLNSREITAKFEAVLGHASPGYSTVAKWTAEFKRGRESLEDDPRSGRPTSSSTEDMATAVQRIIMRDRLISLRCIGDEIGIAKSTVHAIVHNQLQMSKVCTKWVPKSLTAIQRTSRIDCCAELISQFDANPDEFLGSLITGDETWIHHFDPLTQLEAKQWKRSDEPTPIRSRQQRTAGKMMMSIFWDKDGILLTDYLPRGHTVNGAYYAGLIQKLRVAVKEKRRGKLTRGILLLHDNAPPHKSNVAQAAIHDAKFTELNHPAYSPDVAPSDYFLFANLKRHLRGKQYSTNEQLIASVEQFFCDKDVSFFYDALKTLRSRWQRVLDIDGSYIE